ncbi:glutathione S-transferase family protein [Devosia riboflavina]
MSLTLYLHPLASFCHKVMIALEEAQLPYRAVTVDFADPVSAKQVSDQWPVGKIPLLHDEASGRHVPETTIILEYLAERHASMARLWPSAEETRLEARLWDRFFDLYVQQPMQKIVIDRIRPPGANDPHGVAEARENLRVAYAMIEERMVDRVWAVGDEFSIVDCAAFPALFFARIVEPFPASAAALSAYFERLLARPSVASVLAQAQPYFTMFPYRDAMPARFLPGA